MEQIEIDWEAEPTEDLGPWAVIVFTRTDREPGDERGASWQHRTHRAGALSEAARLVSVYARQGVPVVADVSVTP